MKPTGRTASRFSAAAALALLAVALLAAPAAAHASLLSSDPSAGSVLTSAPKRVSLSFSENVRVSATAIQVYDTDAKRVDNGGVKARNNLVTLTLPKMEDGAYVVTWRVTSADSCTLPLSAES